MKVSREKVLAESSSTGFRPDVVEKVIQLLGLLEALQEHPFLRRRVALKGGTALNLFVFNLPRLSVDVDLNYTARKTATRCWPSVPGLRRPSARC